MPWIHLHIWPNGKVFPCCSTLQANPVGDLANDLIVDVWNSNGMKELRLNMLNDIPSKGCKNCYQHQSYNSSNQRQSSNYEFSHKFDLVENTRDDGHVENINFTYFDIRFSNFCNFKCRTCGPQLSSGWYEDHLALHGKHSLPDSVISPTDDPDEFFKQLRPYLHTVEEIYFAGGEPLLMKEHFKVLQFFIDNNMTDVRIRYNTNFSVINYKKFLVLDLWKKFKNIKIGASLDASGQRAEYLRKGTIWSNIVKNRETLLTHAPHINFFISPTISAFNVWHLPDFYIEWSKKGYIGRDGMRFNILFDPDYYQINVLPQKFKDEIILKYEDLIKFIVDKHDDNCIEYYGAKSVIKMLSRDSDISGTYEDFKKQTRALDKLREENLLHAFPEFKEYYE